MTELYAVPHPLNDYLCRRFSCSCGREHYADLRYVAVGPGAMAELPEFVQKNGYSSVCLVSDPTTSAVAGENCLQLLQTAGIRAKLICLTKLAFDEATAGEVLLGIPTDCDLMVAVGSGSISDMTRFVSHRTGRPYCTVATAPSMDGYASSVAALHAAGMKVTLEAQTPLAVFGDTDILKAAPYHMIAAGLGDLMGKFTCLCDWKLSRLINGEHYCRRLADLVESCVDNVLSTAHRAKERDAQVAGQIMEGLVLAGVDMSLYGNSRPASGCEHQMSHYWEMLFAQQGRTPALHGTQVGVGTVLVLKAVEALLGRRVDFEAARDAARQYDAAVWEKNVRTAYGSAAEGVIAMEHAAQKNETAGRLRRIDAMERQWDEIRALLLSLPSSQQVMDLLRSLDSPYLPAHIGVEGQLLKDTFLYCKEVRVRYTFLQMLWDLGLLDDISGAVIAEVEA